MDDLDNEMMNLKNVFGTDLETLMRIVSKYQNGRKFCEEVDYLEMLGQEAFIIKALKTNIKNGIDDQGEEIGQREIVFGSNKKAEAVKHTFFEFLLDALNDFTLKIMMLAASVSIILSTLTANNANKGSAWIQGFSMILAVVIVSSVTAFNDIQKQTQFQDLNNLSESKKIVNIIRGGKICEVHMSEVLVGDICILREGMQIPADGLLIKNSDVTCDESAMTGETNPMLKDLVSNCIIKRNKMLAEGVRQTDEDDQLPSPIIMSGTKVLSGEGRFIVLVVGDNSCEGRIEELMKSSDDITPLQQKLQIIASDIGKFGMVSAIIIVMVLLIRFSIERIQMKSFSMSNFTDILNFIILGIAVIVMAIPEGLPLSVTISLAYSVKKMLNDQNLVRQLQACETMGGADQICSDKTGTLTQNKMTLNKIWNDYNIQIDNYSEKIHLIDYIPKQYQDIFIQATAANSSAILRPQEQGSKTEIAILQFLERCGLNYEKIRERIKEVQKFPFNSSRKRMGMIILTKGQYRLVEKGASEIIMETCSHYHSYSDGIQPIECYKQKIQETIQQLANQALRTICLAYKNLGNSYSPGQQDSKGVYQIEKENLILFAILGIKDTLRKEVPQAVLDCKKAGIKVRMVTGDNILTAIAIAKECHIINPEDNKSLQMEGTEFMERIGGVVCIYCRTQKCDCPREEDVAEKLGKKQRKDTVANAEEFDLIYPNLDVLARSRPEDKYALVTGLKERGHVVAVTGDGTNDAPALKKADVGFAMGIAGTEVAKQAASIILLDDNFSSIVKAVMWGRNIYDCIRKFLQFQLTVNVVGVGITLFGAATIRSEILTPIQMLWINLIMDALASLALATETPTQELLLRQPQSRQEYIVSRKMFKHVIGQSIYQLAVIIFITFCESFIPEEPDSLDTLIDFNVIQSVIDYNEDTNDIDAYNIMLVYKNLRYGIKYGDGNQYKKGSYVRSGRDSLISESKNIYPYLMNKINGTQPAYQGQDFSVIKNLLNLGASRHFTFVFNTFLLMTIFNFFNARKLKDEINVFQGIISNKLFLIIIISVFCIQIFIVTFGGNIFKCYSYQPNIGLTLIQWLICLSFAFGSLIVSFLLKFINEESFFQKRSNKVQRSSAKKSQIFNKNQLSYIKKDTQINLLTKEENQQQQEYNQQQLSINADQEQKINQKS